MRLIPAGGDTGRGPPPPTKQKTKPMLGPIDKYFSIELEFLA